MIVLGSLALVGLLIALFLPANPLSGADIAAPAAAAGTLDTGV
jgi:hypothetical protein